MDFYESVGHINRCRKSIWGNSSSIYIVKAYSKEGWKGTLLYYMARYQVFSHPQEVRIFQHYWRLFNKTRKVNSHSPRLLFVAGKKHYQKLTWGENVDLVKNSSLKEVREGTEAEILKQEVGQKLRECSGWLLKACSICFLYNPEQAMQA